MFCRYKIVATDAYFCCFHKYTKNSATKLIIWLVACFRLYLSQRRSVLKNINFTSCHNFGKYMCSQSTCLMSISLCKHIVYVFFTLNIFYQSQDLTCHKKSLIWEWHLSFSLLLKLLHEGNTFLFILKWMQMFTSQKVVLNAAMAFVARWTVTQNRRGNWITYGTINGFRNQLYTGHIFVFFFFLYGPQ